MASIRITIETDNAAFRDGVRSDKLVCTCEIARILRHTADEFQLNGIALDPRDRNGKVCGKVEAIE